MSKKDVEMITDDIEVVGPGQMLSEARKTLSLSQKDVADKLNFKLSLVKDLENEHFDKSLPETFNRGYLRNFAKLVNINEEDVLASYEMLGVAEKQGAEMQSFSKLTTKQAENNRIMWITYLIIAIILGSAFVWLYQAQQNTPLTQTDTTTILSEQQDTQITKEQKLTAENTELNNDVLPQNTSVEPATQPNNNQVNIHETVQEKPKNEDTLPETDMSSDDISRGSEVEQLASQSNALIDVSFSFNGDCWVNISDATGERIAWGVKKSGYVMNIQGVAPFSITLGKPERVAINYNGDNIDMSQFNRGNIAKFTLPISN